MMEERYHATTQNRFYPDMSNLNKNITVQTKLISPRTYVGWKPKYYKENHRILLVPIKETGLEIKLSTWS